MSKDKHRGNCRPAARSHIGLLDLPWSLRLLVVLFLLNAAWIPAVAGMIIAELLRPLWSPR